MNLNLLPDLALFVQIVDQGSFSAVARQNGITPSAVSRSVSRLEREMGCKLLQRTTRKLRLSDAGKRYISMPSRCWKRRDRQWIPQAVAKRSPRES